MGQPLRTPHSPRPAMRPLALGSPDEIAIVHCPARDCEGGYVGRLGDGMVRVPCPSCGSATNPELRIIAARPDLLAFYPDLGVFGGVFVLRTGASDRELYWCPTAEQAREGVMGDGPLEDWPEVYAALGVAPGEVRR